MTEAATVAAANVAPASPYPADAPPATGPHGGPLGYQVLEVKLIEASPTNPRKTFDATKHEELTESVRQHGVLQPILVRPHPAKRGRYELVAGERRWRATKAAKLPAIPVIVKDLDDLQTLEIQVIENLQRDDLHPLEEAEGYEALMRKHAFTVEQLAGKVGKSKAYIYARLKLCALSPEAREAFMGGRLDASTALLVARIPVPALQKKALEEIAKGGEWLEGGGRAPMSYRKAADHVREHYMLRLDQAPFDVKALYFAGKTAAAVAPPCADCPKRTGNAPDLFGDVANDNVCTDPACFADKRTAHGLKIADEARAKGLEVLTGKEARKVMPTQYGRPAGMVKLTDHNYDDDKNRTWARILGKDAKDKVVLIESAAEPGTFIECVRDKDVAAILKAKGIEAPKRGTVREMTPAEKRDILERKVELVANFQVYLALREEVGRTGITNADLRAIAIEQFDYGFDLPEGLAPYWGLDKDWALDGAKEAIQKADGAQLLQMVFDMLVGASNEATQLAAARGIDVAAIEAKVREELKAQAKSKGKAKPKAAAAEGGENES